jgi:uncharacterized protein YfkK (UPF0435 family)
MLCDILDKNTEVCNKMINTMEEKINILNNSIDDEQIKKELNDILLEINKVQQVSQINEVNSESLSIIPSTLRPRLIRLNTNTGDISIQAANRTQELLKNIIEKQTNISIQTPTPISTVNSEKISNIYQLVKQSNGSIIFTPIKDSLVEGCSNSMVIPMIKSTSNVILPMIGNAIQNVISNNISGFALRGVVYVLNSFIGNVYIPGLSEIPNPLSSNVGYNRSFEIMQFLNNIRRGVKDAINNTK